MARARLPAAISDLEGTQPVLRHSPPILPRSISTTGTPNAAAAAATERPPEPAPITQMSGLRTSATPPLKRSGETRGALARVTRLESLQPLHNNRDQRERAEGRERGEQLRRHQPAEFEVDRALAASRGEARTVGALLRGEHTVEAGAEKRERERRRHDADRGGGHEGAQLHAGDGRHEVDQEKRKSRDQP